MSTKKTKKPARAVRYLLSANPKLQRISLKRLSADGKSAKRRPRAAVVKDSGQPKEPGELELKQSGDPKPSPSAPWTISSRAIAIAAVGVTVFAVLMATRQPPSRVDIERVDAPLQAGQMDIATAGARLDTKQTVPSAAPPVAVVASTHPAAAGTAVKPAAVAPPKASAVESPVKTPTVESVTKAPVVESPAKAAVTASPAKSPATEPAATAPASESTVKTPAAEPTAKPEVRSAAAVTVTGCLETNDEAFRLTDTTGWDAPKSRSWKSGFLKKHSSNIELVDANHTLDLAHHVGQRVAATGTIINREMKAHSLRRVAASCS